MTILRRPSLRLPLRPDMESITKAVSEIEWDEIAKLSGLPPEARPEIASVIAMARAIRKTSQTSKITKGKLERARKAALCLRAALCGLVDDDGTINGMTFFALAQWSGDGDPAVEIVRRKDDLLGLAHWFHVAQLYTSPSGSVAHIKASNLQGLVVQLDKVLEDFERPLITRSKKTGLGFVAFVCRMVDPDVGLGSVEEAMRGVPTRRLAWDQAWQRCDVAALRSGKLDTK
jgi:hypothetical protein